MRTEFIKEYSRDNAINMHTLQMIDIPFGVFTPFCSGPPQHTVALFNMSASSS